MVSKKLEKAKNTRSFNILRVLLCVAALIIVAAHLMMFYAMFDYAEDIEHNTVQGFEGLVVIMYFFIASGAAIFCMIMDCIVSRIALKINNTNNPSAALAVVYSLIALNITSVLFPMICTLMSTSGNPTIIRYVSSGVLAFSLIPPLLLLIRPKIRAVRLGLLRALSTVLLFLGLLGLLILILVLIG